MSILQILTNGLIVAGILWLIVFAIMFFENKNDDNNKQD